MRQFCVIRKEEEAGLEAGSRAVDWLEDAGADGTRPGQGWAGPSVGSRRWLPASVRPSWQLEPVRGP